MSGLVEIFLRFRIFSLEDFLVGFFSELIIFWIESIWNYIFKWKFKIKVGEIDFSTLFRKFCVKKDVF